MIQSSDIHPMRFIQTRPFARKMLSDLRSCETGLAQVDGGKIAAAIRSLVFDHLTRERLNARWNVENIIHAEMFQSHYLWMYEQYGRNTFVLSDRLTGLMIKTDLKGVLMRDIRLPFTCQYIAFGSVFRHGLEADFQNVVDGFYVKMWEDSFSFLFTTRTTGSAKPRWYEFGQFGYVDLKCGTAGTTVEDAVSRWRFADGSDRGLLPVGLEKAVGLAVNSLCYLSSRTDINALRPVYTDDAPAELTSTLKVGRPAKHGSARAELLNRGFSTIRILDVEPVSTTMKGVGPGSELSAHWRRGHWRRQPHGPGRADVRLVWITPTLVRADKGDPEHGHVYIVGDQP